jgi:hypothetical protein
MTDPIEQLRRLVEKHSQRSIPTDLLWNTDLPAILAAWEADREKIENAWHELHNLLDRNMPQDSLASAIAYMIDHSNTGWQRVCGWEKFGKMKDDLLGEKDARIAKLEAVVEALREARDAANALDDAIEARWPDECESAYERKEAAGLRLDTALAALKGGQHETNI